MGEKANITCSDGIALHGRAQGSEHAACEVLRCGQGLGHTDTACRVIDKRHVREGAADIDADPPGHVSVLSLAPEGSRQIGRERCGSHPEPRWLGTDTQCIGVQ